ncbi:MAG: hypothetical protein ACRD0Z_17350 [Acidimicrobiales bacterium]
MIGDSRLPLAEQVVPVVLAERWRGGARQASLARMVAGCDVEEMSADQARRVGQLVGRSGHDDVADVTVVEGAVRTGGDVVVTSNETHIRGVAEAAGKRLRVEAV